MLASIQSKPDENGKVENQVTIEGQDKELLAAFSTITDGLHNHCNIPFTTLLSAFIIGCEGIPNCGKVEGLANDTRK